MSGPALVGFVALLAAVFLFIVALVVWQEAKRRPSYEPLEYVVEDAVRHVEEGLLAEGDSDLKRGDIRRILEWEVFYLQGLAQPDRKNPVETVAGGPNEAVEYIAQQIAMKNGVTYSPEEVQDVLRYEADYLMRIGAVGEPVMAEGGEEE